MLVIKNITTFFKNELLWICVTFLLFVIYILFLLSHCVPTDEQIQYANLSFQMLNGNFFLKNFDLQYTPKIFCNFIFYLVPVKIFGVTSKAINLATFLIIISSVLSAILLIRDNIKRLQTREFLMFVCLVGLTSVPIMHVGLDGAFLPFLFLSLFFMNRYILTDKYIYLIFSVLFAAFLVFGKIVSVVLYIIPLLIYSIVKIFYNQHTKKFFKVFISTLFALSLGLFIHYLFIKFNSSTGLYSTISSRYYVDFYSGNQMIEVLWLKSVKNLMIIQNNFFFAEPIISNEVFMYIYRSIVTVIGLFLTVKISVKTLLGKSRSDFVSFIPSFGFIIFFIFMTSIKQDSFIMFEQCNVTFPFVFAFIIMRYKNLSNYFNLHQYWTLIFVQILIYLLYYYDVFFAKVL